MNEPEIQLPNELKAMIERGVKEIQAAPPLCDRMGTEPPEIVVTVPAESLDLSDLSEES